jgi:hypothetical protein
MRISLIGPGEIEFHFQELLKISKDKFEIELEKIAEAIINSNAELSLLPDKGVSLEIAKRVRKKAKTKSKIIALVPDSDASFGVKHLQEYREIKIDKTPLFDSFINTGDWYKHDMTKGLFGNRLLYLGKSPGTELERNSAEYLIRLLKGFKPNLELARIKIHPDIKIDDNFKLLVYSPFLHDKKLAFEDEAYLKKYGIDFVYIQNPEDLEKKLRK